MNKQKLEADIARQFNQLKDDLDERGRRRFAASESFKIGYGGVALVARATGMAHSTIGAGRRELRAEEAGCPIPSTAPT